AIVVALGLGYGWKRLQAQQAELASAGEENAQTLDTLRERLDQREEAFESLQGDFQDYRQDIDKNLDKVLSELADEQEADPREWLHAEAEYLLRLANQRLQLERDVKGAKALLKAADERLTDADNPALIPVRRAIQSELAALDSVPTVDRTGLYLALMAQQEQLADLPLKQDVEEMAAQNDDDSSLEGGWQQQLSRLGGELKDLVVIRRHDEALEALVTPEQESYLRQNVRLLLEQAQLALLKTEPKLYQASLDKAITLIERYYDTERDAVKTSLERLESLRDKTIRPELPDISESQQTLKDFIEKRFQNGNDDGGGEQRQSDEGDSE
ncbi:uroporphyrinogen-III C-methyltransferase, partial [Chromohalobacter japonicus]